MSSIQDQKLLPFDRHSKDLGKCSLLLSQLHVLQLIHEHLISGLNSAFTQCFAPKDFDHTELAFNISV